MTYTVMYYYDDNYLDFTSQYFWKNWTRDVLCATCVPYTVNMYPKWCSFLMGEGHTALLKLHLPMQYCNISKVTVCVWTVCPYILVCDPSANQTLNSGVACAMLLLPEPHRTTAIQYCRIQYMTTIQVQGVPLPSPWAWHLPSGHEWGM
jgi:hypothetical protein